MTTSHFNYIGIDPGKSGGITRIYKGRIESFKCPDSVEEMQILFKYMLQFSSISIPKKNTRLVMERVWARPNNATRSAFNYGVNYGQWLGIIASYNIEINTILPTEWIRYYGCDKKLEYNERKKWLKQKAQVILTNYRTYCWKGIATLSLSDSILIAHYGKREYFNK
tara:strand:+ start:70 stop:570 length:501 start_codon:yes stop_codon:yes gene_type:complete